MLESSSRYCRQDHGTFDNNPWPEQFRQIFRLLLAAVSNNGLCTFITMTLGPSAWNYQIIAAFEVFLVHLLFTVLDPVNLSISYF